MHRRDYNLTALRGAKVLARGGSTGTRTTSLLNAESAAFNSLALETIPSSIGHIRCDHLDEAKATRLSGVGVLHDLTFLDVAVLLEQPCDLGFLETRVNARDKEVGAGVDGAIIVTIATLRAIVLDRSTVLSVRRRYRMCIDCRTAYRSRSLPLGDMERRRDEGSSSRRGDALRSRS